MDIEDSEKTYSLNKFLLCMSGQWPDQIRSKQIAIRILFLSFICISLFGQFSAAATRNLNFQAICDFIPQLTLMIMALTSTVALYLSDDTLSKILQRLHDKDWCLWKTEEEIGIKQRYVENGQFYTKFFIVYFIAITIIFLCTMLMPQILDIIMPLNESRPRRIPMIMEFFIDEEKYFYYIFFHICFMSFIGTIMTATNIALFLVNVEHVCGIFALTGYRLEHVFDDRKSVKSLISDRNNTVHQSINFIIKHHRNALEYIGLMNDYYGYFGFLQLIAALLIITFTLAEIREVEDGTSIVMCVASTIYFFLCSMSSQKLMDMSFEVSIKAYSGRWYNSSVSLQKLLLLIMERSQKSTSLILGNLVPMSAESFRTFMQTFISYCMVLRNVH